MKTFAIVVAFACLAHSALGSVVPKECLGGPSNSCSAVSTLQIEVTSGKCSGTSRANCKTWTDSQSAFQEAFEEWWSEGDKVCDSNKVEVAARAVASAVAKIWVSAAIDVECEDEAQGFACGWAFADGKAFATAIAEAIATAAADASLALEASGDTEGAGTADAFCFTDVRAVGTAFTQAAANAATDACTKGGEDPVSTYESSFVSTINTVVADAFASASAGVCATEDGADITAESLCEGTGEVTQEGKREGDGNFCFGFQDPLACEGKGAATCCGNDKRRCFIRGCRSCKSPWTSIKTPKGDDRQFWRNRSGTICFCKDE